MSTRMTSRITNLTIVYSAVDSGADEGEHQSFASLAFARGIHRWPVSYPHKGPTTPKFFSFDDAIMNPTKKNKILDFGLSSYKFKQFWHQLKFTNSLLFDWKGSMPTNYPHQCSFFYVANYPRQCSFFYAHKLSPPIFNVRFVEITKKYQYFKISSRIHLKPTTLTIYVTLWSWPLTADFEQLIRGSITNNMSAKLENNSSSALWFIAFISFTCL